MSGDLARRRVPVAAVVAVLTAVGVALRLVVADQSLFADELSTHWIVSTNGLGDVVSTVRTDVEITPPLYFVMAWLTTRIDLTPELLRAPSLLAGSAVIPLTYLLGLRTVGRGAALIAAALTALAPHMIYSSTDARGYAVMLVFVMLSTLALLAVVDGGRARWWVIYGACTCAAVYTHYTSVFALAAQLLWLWWAHPESRRAALLANAGAVIAFLPWLPGLRADFDSPTTDIVDSFNAVSLETARATLGHWSIGHPYVIPNTALRELPGVAALVLLALGLTIAVAGLVASRFRAPPRLWLAALDRRLVLICALALSLPVGTALFSAAGTNLFGARYLVASWPAFALLLAALLVACPSPARVAAVALTVISFGFGAAKMLDGRFQRPDHQAVADFIDREAGAGDVVVDGTTLSPAPVTALDVPLERRQAVFHLGRPRVRYDTFEVLAAPPTTQDVIRRARAAARGRRIFVVASETPFGSSAPTEVGQIREIVANLSGGYRRVEARTYPGILRLTVLVYVDRASPRG